MSAGRIVLDGVEVAVAAAELELYHDDTDWNLSAETADGRPIRISGIADGALAPGRRLVVQYVDEPSRVEDRGQVGLLTVTDADTAFVAVAVDEARARLEGELALDWTSAGWEGTPSRTYRIGLALDVALRRR